MAPEDIKRKIETANEEAVKRMNAGNRSWWTSPRPGSNPGLKIG